jgi:hypothetical protein
MADVSWQRVGGDETAYGLSEPKKWAARGEWRRGKRTEWSDFVLDR